jgi:hypothetical protein
VPSHVTGLHQDKALRRPVGGPHPCKAKRGEQVINHRSHCCSKETFPRWMASHPRVRSRQAIATCGLGPLLGKLLDPTLGAETDPRGQSLVDRRITARCPKVGEFPRKYYGRVGREPPTDSEIWPMERGDSRALLTAVEATNGKDRTYAHDRGMGPTIQTKMAHRQDESRGFNSRLPLKSILSSALSDFLDPLFLGPINPL